MTREITGFAREVRLVRIADGGSDPREPARLVTAELERKAGHYSLSRASQDRGL